MSAGNPWDAQQYGGRPPEGQPQPPFGPPQQAPFGPPPQAPFGPPQQAPFGPPPQQQFPQQGRQFPHQPPSYPQPQLQQPYAQYQQQPYPPYQQQPYDAPYQQPYSQPRPSEPGRVMRVVALITLILAMVTAAGNEWATVGIHFLAGGAATLVVIVGLGIAAGAMLDRRARNWSAGLAVGLALSQAPTYIQGMTSGQQFWDYFWAYGALLTTVLAALFAFIALQRERPGAAAGAKAPIPALAFGIPAVLLCAISDLIVDFTYTYTDSSDRFPCCSWSQQNGQAKVSNVLTILTLATVVLYAALATRPGLAKSLLAGAFGYAVGQAVGLAVVVLAPGATFSHPQGMTGTHVLIGTGLWCALAAPILFALAFLIHRPGTTNTPQVYPPYPQQPGQWPHQ